MDAHLHNIREEFSFFHFCMWKYICIYSLTGKGVFDIAKALMHRVTTKEKTTRKNKSMNLVFYNLKKKDKKQKGSVHNLNLFSIKLFLIYT